MVEQSTAASHAPANGAVELARLMGPFSTAAAAHDATAGRPNPPLRGEPLPSKAFSLGDTGAVRFATLAEIDTWEEF